VKYLSAAEISAVRRRKYRVLAKAPVYDWGRHLKDFKSGCLRHVAEAFQSNIIRTSNFALMPAWIALEVTREQLWLDHATVKTGGKIEPDLAKFISQHPDPEALALVNQLIMRWRKTPTRVFRKLLDEIGIDWVETRLYWSQGISHGISALFETIIVESWTAFETLCRDMWIVTLDNDNGSIAERVDVSRALQKARKNLTSTFDIKTHPGSFQVDTRQATFQKLGDIKKLYEAGFGKTAVSLFDSVEGGYITVLNAFRNVITHKCGKADRGFRHQLKDFAEFNSIREGDEIKLDGEMVAKMRNAALLLGRKLIETADAELLTQKQSV
jgi:hypothetical protein